MAPRAIETELTIEGNVADVWRVLLDFSRYHEWNPWIRSVQMPAHYSKLTESCVWKQLPMEIEDEVHNRNVNKAPKIERPVILIVNEEKELRWYKGSSGLFRLEHYFILTSRGPFTTQLRHGERLSGILQPFRAGNSYMAKTRQRIEAMNAALKRRVEDFVDGQGYVGRS